MFHVEQSRETNLIESFDIIVVGGGHAGIEAAWIAAELDLKVGLISQKNVQKVSL